MLSNNYNSTNKRHRMKRVFLLFTFLIIAISVSAKTTANLDSLHLESLKKEVQRLNKEIDEIKTYQQHQGEQINNQNGMIDTAFDGVSAELSATSNFIGIFGVSIAIFSIGLSIYVSRIEKNVKAMRAVSELLLQKNILIKQDLESLSEKITKDSTGLYKLIRNEESNQILNRLISVPEDIHNLFSNLASRDLEKEHFLKLKEAFIQLKESEDGYFDYLTLFFEHFSDLSLLDKDIKPKFLKSLDNNFTGAFKNDVLNSAKDFFSAVLELSISKSISETNEYVSALCKSKFASSEDVYFTINNAMKNRENKFELYDSISKAPDYLLFRKVFGKLILDYKFENLTPKEEAIIQDIKNITSV